MRPLHIRAKGCPACEADVRTQHLLCRECWHLVPTIEQRAVQESWHRYKRAGGLGRPLINKRATEYEQARQTAIGTAIAAVEAAEASAKRQVEEEEEDVSCQ